MPTRPHETRQREIPSAIAAAATALAVVSGAWGAGCDQQAGPIEIMDPSTTACKAQQAQILVGDGYLENACGCQEAGGQPTPQGTPLTCTVTAGTTVFFIYFGTQLFHQIISTGSPAFEPSPPFETGGSMQVPIWPVQLNTPGSYAFEDAYNTTMSGTLVAH